MKAWPSRYSRRRRRMAAAVAAARGPKASLTVRSRRRSRRPRVTSGRDGHRHRRGRSSLHRQRRGDQRRTHVGFDGELNTHDRCTTYDVQRAATPSRQARAATRPTYGPVDVTGVGGGGGNRRPRRRSRVPRPPSPSAGRRSLPRPRPTRRNGGQTVARGWLYRRRATASGNSRTAGVHVGVHGVGTHTLVASTAARSTTWCRGHVERDPITVSGGGGRNDRHHEVTLTTSAASGRPSRSTATVTGTDATGSVNFIDGVDVPYRTARREPDRQPQLADTATFTTATLPGPRTASRRVRGRHDQRGHRRARSDADDTGTPPAPVPKISLSLNNTLVHAPQTVTITATARETGGTIAKVSLY